MRNVVHALETSFADLSCRADAPVVEDHRKVLINFGRFFLIDNQGASGSVEFHPFPLYRFHNRER